jgi:PilZ domain
MDSRRRVPRHVAGWTGSCHIDEEPVDRHWECRVLDISELGLAIHLQHPLGVELIGRRMSVESPTASTSVNIRLEGDVRNAVPVGGDAVRLGIEFVDLTELEQTVVRALGILNLTG